MSADAVLHLLAELLPAGAVVVEEAPSYRTSLRTHLPIAEPGGFFNGFSGGLGWGLPAAVGGALADPSHRTVAVMGDGSMMYSIQALWTAARHRVPLTVVVLNNREYGAMKEFKTLFGILSFPDVIEMSLDLPDIDLPAIAEGSESRGFGATMPLICVTSCLRPSLTTARRWSMCQWPHCAASARSSARTSARA